MKTPRRATLSPKGARAETLAFRRPDSFIVHFITNVQTPGKGAAFPHSRRRSRRSLSGNQDVFLTSLAMYRPASTTVLRAPRGTRSPHTERPGEYWSEQPR